ncbi:MAG: hypothetical protein LBG89_03740 [Rickettsiales bacterium]|jgi:hypothetical protein|nr:hypothetical protein [Rickettsiales bacterium]
MNLKLVSLLGILCAAALPAAAEESLYGNVQGSYSGDRGNYSGSGSYSSGNRGDFARPFANDVEDPLWLGQRGSILTYAEGGVFLSKMELSPGFQWALNNQMSVGASVAGRYNFNEREDGISNVNINGVYRLSEGREITDLLLGVRLGLTDSYVWDYRDDIYMVGFRFGTARNKITLAMDILTNWVFDKDQGHAFINFIPAVYMRLDTGINVGGEIDFRKDTDYQFGRDDVRMGVAANKRFGSTTWMAGTGYIFSDHAIYLRARLSVLF